MSTCAQRSCHTGKYARRRALRPQQRLTSRPKFRHTPALTAHTDLCFPNKHAINRVFPSLHTHTESKATLIEYTRRVEVLRQREWLIINRCSLPYITTHALWRSFICGVSVKYISLQEAEARFIGSPHLETLISLNKSNNWVTVGFSVRNCQILTLWWNVNL